MLEESCVCALISLPEDAGDVEVRLEAWGQLSAGRDAVETVHKHDNKVGAIFG